MFTKSDTYKEEYCAQIVKIGKLEPIENSDFLVKTTIGSGYQVVVGKNDVKEGDIMVYCKLETEINHNFISVNNQFEIGERHLNSNHIEVESLVRDGKIDEAKKLCGYFNKHARVRIVKLRGCPSEGCLFTIDSLIKWNNKIANYDFSQCFIPNNEGIIEPFNFDTIDGELFVKAYVPHVPTGSVRGDRTKKRNKHLKRFDRLVEGQFTFHYDTNQLSDNIWKIKPNDMVTITVKEHGTSLVSGNLLTKKPLPVSKFRKFYCKVNEKKLKRSYKRENRFYWQKKENRKIWDRYSVIIEPKYKVCYGEVTSSRGVIKNQYINNNLTGGFYGNTNIWSDYGKLLYKYLPEGMTIYGEIVGYVSNDSMVQKNYDYGCAVGTSKLMPYRITTTDVEGNHKEWELSEVWGWTIDMIEKHPEIAEYLQPIVIVYHGTLANRYPEIPINDEWGKNIVECLRNDKEFNIEGNEPLCKIKVPREGIVVRIDNDVKAEAFKLKGYKFLGKEAESMDKGEVDMEMDITYNN